VRVPGTPPVWGHPHARAWGPKPFCPEEGTRARVDPAHHLRRARGGLGALLGFGVPGHAPGPRCGHAPAGADLSPPAGRRMPCGRRRRALTPRCPTRRPTMRGCVPAAARISASSPGGTTAGGLGGHWGWHRVARCSPPALLPGSARARCATRAPWTQASRGDAACFATSKGTHRLREPGPQPSRRAWDTPCPGCLLLDLPGTQASGASRQVLLPSISGLRRVFLVAGPQRGKQPAPATTLAPMSSIGCHRIDPQSGCRVGGCRYGGV